MGGQTAASGEQPQWSQQQQQHSQYEPSQSAMRQQSHSPLRSRDGAHTYNYQNQKEFDQSIKNSAQQPAQPSKTVAVGMQQYVGGCGASQTEKERLIAQLMAEAAELRQRERDYHALQDQLLNLEQNFGRLNEDKRRMDEDYKARVDGNIRFIQTLRAEVDEQKSIYNERKRQNAELNTELDRQRTLISDRNIDIQRVKHELQVSEDQNASLQSQKRQCDDELAALRDRNREDLEEIDRLNVANEMKQNEG